MTNSKSNEAQHDDHIWLTVHGEAWAIRAMHWPVIWLWRGYWPDLEYTVVRLDNFNSDHYADAAVAMMYRKDKSNGF